MAEKNKMESGISAIIPVLNTDPYEMDQAVISLIRSRIASEIILVDNGTRIPESVSCLQKWSELGARVITSTPGSAPIARATGIHSARGKYIINMDSDDLIYDRGIRKDELAPINLGTQNTSYGIPNNIFDYIESPGEIQWGSILRTDLAKSLCMATGRNRHEDIQWAFRVMLASWKRNIPIKMNSGVHYWWRSEKGRNSLTAIHKRNKQDFIENCRLGLVSAIENAGLNENEALAIRLLSNRRAANPLVHREEKGYRVDTHVLHYSGRISWLKECLRSLENEPTNLHLVVGGFRDSIGAARSFAFGLGDSEYVCFMDDDDMIIPGAMKVCIDYLDQNPDCVGAYTDRKHLRLNGSISNERLGDWNPRRMVNNFAEITHLKIMRRSLVNKYLDELAKWRTWEEYVLCCLISKHGRWHHLPVFGAIKRMVDSKQSSVRLSGSGITERALNFVRSELRENYGNDL